MAAGERPALDRPLQIQVPCGHVGGARALGRFEGGEVAARARARALGRASAARRNARTTHARGPGPRPRSGCPGRRRGRWEALVGALPG